MHTNYKLKLWFLMKPNTPQFQTETRGYLKSEPKLNSKKPLCTPLFCNTYSHYHSQHVCKLLKLRNISILTHRILSEIHPSPSGLAPSSPCEPGDAIGTSLVCRCWDVCRPHRQISVTQTKKSNVHIWL